MAYERLHTAILRQRMAEPRKRIQIVMGPRQVGKTTMVEQFARSQKVPFDFFAADGVNRYDSSWIPRCWQEQRIKMDLHQEKERIIIIDEVQKIDNWSELVKKEWDADTRNGRNIKAILLGSSRVLLQKGLEESLAERFETIKMGYWDLKEMQEAFGMSLNQYIYFGGFPGLVDVIADENRWRNLIEDSIISPILSRDILEVEEIRNYALLRQVFELACIESAKELSLTKLQNSLNSGTVPTIKTYLTILDQTMTVKPLQKYSPSVIREKSSVPKLQVYNSGFRNRYVQHTFEQALTNQTEWGRQVESAVGAHLANHSILDGFELMYWRNEHKLECDYVLKKGERIAAIEVKSGSAKNTEGFEAFKKNYPDRISSALIVGPEGLPLEDFFRLKLEELL